MDRARMMAYRDLLYVALNQIRQVRNWFEPPYELSDPANYPKGAEVITMAGDVANWLENLAGFSTFDFDGFDEERFWREHAELCEQFPGVAGYREWFESRLKEFGAMTGTE